MFWFVLIGPGVGGYTFFLMADGPGVNNPAFPGLLLISYVFGTAPAFLAAVLDGILLWSYKSSEEELSFCFAVLLGGLSGLVVGMGFGLIFGVWSEGLEMTFIFGFLAMFAIPGAVCGVFNRVAWRQLSR